MPIRIGSSGNNLVADSLGLLRLQYLFWVRDFVGFYACKLELGVFHDDMVFMKKSAN